MINQFPFDNVHRLAGRNYVRKADPACNYVFDFSEAKVRRYAQSTGDDFNLVIRGSGGRPRDFFVIPYGAVRHMLVQQFLTRDQTSRPPRWTGKVIGGRLRIDNCPVRLDVRTYYGNAALLGAGQSSREPRER